MFGFSPSTQLVSGPSSSCGPALARPARLPFPPAQLTHPLLLAHASASSSSSHRGRLLRGTLGPQRPGASSTRAAEDCRRHVFAGKTVLHRPASPTTPPAAATCVPRPHRAGAGVLPANRTTTPSRTGRRRRRRRCSGTWWPRSSPSSPAPRQSPKPYTFRRFPFLVSFWLASFTPYSVLDMSPSWD